MWEDTTSYLPELSKDYNFSVGTEPYNTAPEASPVGGGNMWWAAALKAALPMLMQGMGGMMGKGDEKGFQPMGLPQQGQQQQQNPEAMMIMQKIFEDIERRRMESDPLYRLQKLYGAMPQGTQGVQGIQGGMQ